MIHERALTSEAKELFPMLARFRDRFYLAGGTALALQLGHRVSVDFDLFSYQPIKKDLLTEIEEAYASSNLEVQVNNSGEFTALIQGVKHTFLQYPFPLVAPLLKNDPIDMLSSGELLVTKAYTIGRRGSFKDYVDLYTGLKEGVATLAGLIELAHKKYGDAFNDRLFLEQLLYSDDIEEGAIVMLDREMPTKQIFKDFFSMKIGELKL